MCQVSAGPFLREFCRDKAKWTFGLLKSRSVLYLRSNAIGHDVARAVLSANGVRKHGKPLPEMSEVDLMAAFGRSGLEVAGRLVDYESVYGCRRAGFLRDGRRA